MRVFVFWTEHTTNNKNSYKLESYCKFEYSAYFNLNLESGINSFFRCVLFVGLTLNKYDYWIVGIVICAIKLIKICATTTFGLRAYMNDSHPDHFRHLCFFFIEICNKNKVAIWKRAKELSTIQTRNQD